MNAAPKALLTFGFLAVAFGVGYTLWGGGGSPAPTPIGDPQGAQPEAPKNTPPPEVVKASTGSQLAASREQVTNSNLIGSGDTFAQGVTGFVVDPSGAPVVGAEIALVISPHANIFRALQKNQAGIKDPPVAMTVTDEKGQFSAGVAEVTSRLYDLWVFHPEWADYQKKGLSLNTGDWFDAQEVRLAAGCTVFGRVTEENTGVAIVGAQVLVQRNDQLSNFNSIPGRDGGPSTVTDANGAYRIPNASAGAVTLIVDDPRYAKASQPNLILQAGNETQSDFVLGLGYAIRGVVLNDEGAPVGGTTVQAVSLSAKQPQAESAITANDGRFEIPGLRDGAFQLSVTAKDYQPAKVSPVLSAEDEDTEIVLENKNGINVRVIADNNQAIRDYRLRVLRWFPANSSMGAVPDIQARRITAADMKNGVARVEGVNFGHYVLEVRAQKFAKSFSEPFEIKPGTVDPTVEVVVEAGATVVGRVIDQIGKGVAGATVSTEANNQMDLSEGGLADLFGQMVKNAPKRISTVDVTTDPNGNFQINNLPYGDYQLRISHADHVRAVQANISLADPGEYQVPPVILQRGCLVTGRASVAGKAQGQIKVSLHTPNPESIPGQPMPTMTPEMMANRVATSAVTLNDGTFRLLKRIPPGTYEIQAERMTAGPFEKMLDHRNSKQTITIGAQETAEVSINIRAQ